MPAAQTPEPGKAPRYALIPFDPAVDRRELLSRVLEFAESEAFFGGTLSDPRGRPWESVVQHFADLGCVTLLVQCGITDPDFIDEHAAFYAKQHKVISRRCLRLHGFAFEGPPDGNDPQAVISFLDHAATTERDEGGYLGFITLRPLRHARVGASILQAPDTVTVRDCFPVHIGGNRYRIEGTPFLQQDSAVGACAQASIWMALRTVRRRFGNAAYSTAELTIAATRFLTSDRVFPGRGGLDISQMLEAIRFTGHDPLHLDLKRKDTDAPDGADITHAEEVINRAGPYLESGLPVILALKHSAHCVVAVGRVVDCAAHADTRTPTRPTNRSAEDWIAELVVHNDNTGPYVRLTDHARANEDEWYSLDDVANLVIPLPDAVFTTAFEARELGARTLRTARSFFSLLCGVTKDSTPEDMNRLFNMPTVEVTLRTYLCKRHDFRRWAKRAPELDPATVHTYRTLELPALIWVVELHLAEHFNPKDRTASRCGEVLLDASADWLHGDAVIAVRVTGHLFKEGAVVDSQMLLIDTRPDPVFMRGPAGQLGHALWEPWRSDD